MINSVDTNILLDILIPNAAQLQSSLQSLSNIDPDDELIISEVVFAELGSQFKSFNDLNRIRQIQSPAPLEGTEVRSSQS
jgi:predicted nucleic acid-binding protein